MSIEKYTPASIVKHDIIFRIPLYQRLFAWPTTEVEQLLKDLEHHYKFPQNRTEPYYMGIITQMADRGRMVLIDGQQRLTVLLLMGIVFSHEAQSSAWKNFARGGKRIELFARPDDQKFLERMATNVKDIPEPKNRLMPEAMKTIQDFVRKLENPAMFADCIYNSLTLLVSSLPAEYQKDPNALNMYFENMNSAGKNLEQHEVLKVELVQGQADKSLLLAIWHGCENFSRPLLRMGEEVWAEGQWQNFLLSCPDRSPDFSLPVYPDGSGEGMADASLTIAEIAPEKKENFSARQSGEERGIVSFPQFLLLALDIFNNINGGWAFHNAGRLLENFRNNDLRHVKRFYAFMYWLRCILDYYVIRRDDEDSYTLLAESGKQASRLLSQYQAMLNVSTPRYEWLREFLLEIMSRLRKGSLPDCQSLLTWLKEWDNGRRLSGDLSENVLRPENMRYENIDRYWFWRLDYILWEKVFLGVGKEEESPKDGIFAKDQTDAVKAYVFRANRSIEHLHPQNQSLNPDNWADVSFFGNLAMISASFNSQQSNENVHVKFSRLETQLMEKSLQSLKLLAMYNAAREHGQWDVAVALKHEQKMLDLLRDSFSNTPDAGEA